MRHETRCVVLLVGSATQAVQAALAETTLPIEILSVDDVLAAQRVLRKRNDIVVVVLSEGECISLGELLASRLVEPGSVLDKIIMIDYSPTTLVPGRGHITYCVSGRNHGYSFLVEKITESVEYRVTSDKQTPGFADNTP